MSDQAPPRFQIRPQIVIGLAVTAWGLLLMAGNLGWINKAMVWRLMHFWPLAIVAVGVTRLLSATSRSAQVFAGVITFIGVWLTAEVTYGFDIHFWRFWPLLLVAAGVIMMSRAWESGSTKLEPRLMEGAGYEIAFWSGIERRVSAPDFRHADLTAIMGGIWIDLRGAKTATGEAVIDVFALWGGIEIVVPPDWAVVNQIRPIMGGVEDHSTGLQTAQHKLVLRGFAVMGGVEIKT